MYYSITADNIKKLEVSRNLTCVAHLFRMRSGNVGNTTKGWATVFICG